MKFDEFISKSGKLIDLEQHRRIRMIKDFTTRAPLFRASDSLLVIQDELVQIIQNQRKRNVVFPITRDLTPFWGLNLGVLTFFNSLYPIYTAVYSCLASYPNELSEEVDGVLIQDEAEYNRLLKAYNDIANKALTEHNLDEREFVRLCALFICITFSADRTLGLEFDMHGDVVNKWSGEPTEIYLGSIVTNAYAHTLTNSFFAGLPENQYFHQYLSKFREEQTMWVYNLSEMDLFGNERLWGYSISNLCEVFDHMHFLNQDLHRFLFILPSDARSIEAIKVASTYNSRFRFGEIDGYQVLTTFDTAYTKSA